MLINSRCILAANYGLSHASEALILEGGHQWHQESALILGRFEQIIIVLELFSEISFSFMFFLQLIFVVEKNLYVDVVDIKAGEIFVPLAIWENFSLLRDVELADYYFSDLLHIPLEVDYQL